MAGLLWGLWALAALRREIDDRLAGGAWPVPTKIYSAPFVIRAGSRIGADALAERLERLGYRRSAAAPAAAGEFRKTPAGVELRSRSFTLGGRTVAESAVRVRFDGGTIAAIDSLPARPRSGAVELEPETLATLYGPQREDRIVLPLAEFPPVLRDAVIASEDRRFYDHHGLDPIRIAGAALQNVRSGGVVEGGSTITQQTVKNLFLSQERTWARKLREAALAVVLESSRTKDQILELYLNEIYLGQKGSVAVCGFGEAARFYFGRDVRNLDLAEAATLVGLIPSPGSYNPYSHPDRALERRGLVLDALAATGRISAEDAGKARKEPLRLGSGGGGSVRAPYFVELVRRQLAESYPEDVLTAGGLQVFTSLDPLLQRAAEDALIAGLARLERDRPNLRRKKGDPLEGAIVTLRPGTGEILALVGGRDFQRSQFDRVTQGRRQPGSAFKPIVYLAGFERSLRDASFVFTPATQLDDSPLELVSGGTLWRPENDDETFRGPVTVRQAIEQSLNVPAVRAGQMIGLDAVVSTARRLGVVTPLEPWPSLALGAQEIAPIELAVAYATIAGNGVRAAPTAIREVAGPQGTVLARRTGTKKRAVPAAAAYLCIDQLRGVVDRGTAHAARDAGIAGDWAGKTGTTNERRDAWFAGLSADLVDVVWVGFDDAAPTGLAGSSGALPIWIDYVRRSQRAGGGRPFEEPPGLERVSVDPMSGGRAVAGCPETIDELFLAGAVPQEDCALHADGLGGWFRRLFGRPRPPQEPPPREMR